MAEEKAKSAASAEVKADAGPAQKPTLFIILAIVICSWSRASAFMLYAGHKKEAAKPSIDQVVQGEHENQVKDADKEDEFIGKVVPLETFVINLAEAVVEN